MRVFIFWAFAMIFSTNLVLDFSKLCRAKKFNWFLLADMVLDICMLFGLIYIGGVQ